MANMGEHQRKLREDRQRLFNKVVTEPLAQAENENEARREQLAKQIRVDGREVTQARLDAICELVRVSMPGAVREAFSGELRALQAEIRDGGRRDTFARGVWAGWSSLLTEMIRRLDNPPEELEQHEIREANGYA